VLQSGKLMAGSILTNILGAFSLTIEDAWEAARLAGLACAIRIVICPPAQHHH
jgi:ABC-type bacteriocin/lantibiotic exporter with double-glycine peptidase domain